MKNPIVCVEKCFNNVKRIKKDILLKEQEIDSCNKQLDEIKFKKDSTSFKWYDVKRKSEFNDDVKSEKKLIKAKIFKLENEIKDLKKAKKDAVDKRNKLFLIVGIILFVIIIIISIVGTVNEKTYSEPQTTGYIETMRDMEITTVKTTTADDQTKSEINSEATSEYIVEKNNKVITENKTKEETSSSTTSRSQKIVYGSRTGNHYHIGGCRYANGAKMTVAEAERKGWNPCAVCNP